ncbi:MAG: hypothetical protein IT373_04490 [Polyangiaceae bacterium]|nr:hypothetical protein [Polyangiaceae bacterium]
MTDERVVKSQRLFWELETLRALGVHHRDLVARLEPMAELHEDRARCLLAARDEEGWVDLFAAITAWAEAGSAQQARDLVRFGRECAANFQGADSLAAELDRLDAWLGKLSVVPPLADFARSVPAFGREAA